MGNIVKLVFQAIATGSGFGKLLGEVKGLNEKMPGLSKAAQIVGMSFGTAGAAAGRMVSMLLQGSIWGVAAEGAKLLIDKLGIFKDRSAETKEKLDKLEESTRKFYETINSNSQKALAKIDAETKRRNEQLDITNRMIKAELQLQKAKAIASRDAKQVERIDRQITEADQTTAMSKAVSAEQASGKAYRRAEGDLDTARNLVNVRQEAIKELKDNIFYGRWDKERSKAEAMFKASFGKDARFDDSALWNDFRKKFRFSKDETKQIDAAKELLSIAEKNLESTRKTADERRAAYQQARDNVKALKAEQEAADAEAEAKKTSATKAAMKKEFEEQIKAREEKTRSDKEASEKLAEEERKRIAKEKEEKRRQMMAELQEEVKKNNEKRKKALQKDIEANRKRADDLKQKLEKAEEAAKKARDVLGNAAGMDQAGDLSDKRRAALTDDRYTNASIDLVAGKKIRKGAEGKWESAGGRLSNFNQAVMDRMNAEAEKRKLEGENDKVVKKLDELIKKFEELTSL